MDWRGKQWVLGVIRVVHDDELFRPTIGEINHYWSLEISGDAGRGSRTDCDNNKNKRLGSVMDTEFAELGLWHL